MKLKPTTPEITTGHTVPRPDLTPSGRPHLVIDGTVTARPDAPPAVADAVRSVLAQAAAMCGERRPGYATDGMPEPGYVETDELDSLPCTITHGHTGDHRDAAARTWAGAGQTSLVATRPADSVHHATVVPPASPINAVAAFLTALGAPEETVAPARQTLAGAVGMPPGSAAEIGAQIAARVAAEVPSLAEKISQECLAAIMTGALIKTGIVALTAAERGPEWMTRFRCTPTCILDHAGADGEPGWHQGPAVEIMAPTLSSNQLPGELPVPLLSARITTANDEPDVFGVRTELWVETDGDTLELSLDQTDTLIESLEQALPRLRVLRAQLAEESKNDRPRNPEAVAEVHARWDAERDARLAAAKATTEAHA